MAIFNGRDYSLTVNAVDLSDHVRRIRIDMSSDDLDGTAMGDTAHTHIPGLRNDRVELEMFQDHGSGSVDATLSPLVGDATGVTVVIKPTSSSVSTTNPSYTFTGILLDYTPADAEVGTLSTTPVVFVPAPGSSIVRATT